MEFWLWTPAQIERHERLLNPCCDPCVCPHSSSLVNLNLGSEHSIIWTDCATLAYELIGSLFVPWDVLQCKVTPTSAEHALEKQYMLLLAQLISDHNLDCIHWLFRAVSRLCCLDLIKYVFCKTLKVGAHPFVPVQSRKGNALQDCLGTLSVVRDSLLLS